MAKPEMLDTIGLERAACWVTFETKERAVIETAKRGGTRRIATLADHKFAPLCEYGTATELPSQFVFGWESLKQQ